MDKVIVAALYGIKPGVGQALHRDNIKNGNIIRQYFIQAEEEVKIPFLLNINMKKKLTRMYLRVSSPATGNVNGYF